jgi:hypothetical protein
MLRMPHLRGLNLPCVELTHVLYQHFSNFLAEMFLATKPTVETLHEEREGIYIVIFWGFTPCSLVVGEYQRFGGIFCLYLQSRRSCYHASYDNGYIL